MGVTTVTTSEQRALWNGRAGIAWVEGQELLDAMFEPFSQLLVDGVRAAAATRVLDVGCGTGTTTLTVARAAGAECVGVDISEPMLAAARARAGGASARFVCADAQTHAFEKGWFDMVISRFGVMFFDDPVRAFSNLRGAARDGAHLELIAWRSPAENAFMTTAERAAAPLLPQLPSRDPDAPGQFAFADPRRVRTILEQSGWTEIEIAPCDATCTFPASELTRYVTRLGPLGLIFEDLSASIRDEVFEAVRAAFAPYVRGSTVRYEAACWRIAGRAG